MPKSKKKRRSNIKKRIFALALCFASVSDLMSGTVYAGEACVQEAVMTATAREQVTGEPVGKVDLSHLKNATHYGQAAVDSSNQWTGFDHVFSFELNGKKINGYCVDFEKAALGCDMENTYGVDRKVTYDIYKLSQSSNNYEYLRREFYYADPSKKTYGYNQMGWENEKQARTALRFCLEDSYKNRNRRSLYDKAGSLWEYVKLHELPQKPTISYEGQTFSGNKIYKNYKFISFDGASAKNSITAEKTAGVRVFYCMPDSKKYTENKPVRLSNGTLIRFEIDAEINPQYTYTQALETDSEYVDEVYYARPSKADDEGFQSLMFAHYASYNVVLHVSSDTSKRAVRVKKSVSLPDGQKEKYELAISDYTAEGCEYKVYKEDGSLASDEILLIGSDGASVNAVALSPGSYYLQETKANSYTLKNTAKYPFVIYNTDTKNELVVNTSNAPAYTYLTIEKKIKDENCSKYPLDGCRFDFYAGEFTGKTEDYKGVKNTNYIGSIYTDKDGNSVGNDGKPIKLPVYKGVYTVIEAVSNPYLLPVEPFSFEVGKEDILSKLEHDTNKKLTVAEPAKYGRAVIKKSSSNEEITAGNQLYELNDAVYYMYDDRETAEKGFYEDRLHIAQAVTDSKGEGVFEVDGVEKKLILGRTYYIKEVRAGKGYSVNTSVMECKVDTNDIAAEGIYEKQLKVSEKPKYKNLELLCIKKGDNSALLENVWFKAEYYNSQAENASPERVWYFKTDSDGCVKADNAHLIAAEELAGKFEGLHNSELYEENGGVYMPLGVLKLTEIWSPYDPYVGSGLEDYLYKLNGTETIINIFANGVEYINKNGEHVNSNNITYVVPEIVNERVEPVIASYAHGEEGTKNILATANSVIIDEVSYDKLSKGRSYRLKGVIVDAATGEAVADGTRELTAVKDFVAVDEKGQEEVRYLFDASAHAGQTLVIYERLYELVEADGIITEVLRAEHCDIADENQKIYVPAVTTAANDTISENQNVVIDKDAGVRDLIYYENLILGEEYSIKGQLIDKENGAVVAEEMINEYVPEKRSGYIPMNFLYDATAHQGKELVVYEYVYNNSVLVARHEDKYSEKQTVYATKLATRAASNKVSKNILAAKGQAVEDTVRINGGAPGDVFTVRGRLYDVTAGEFIITDNETMAMYTVPEGENNAVAYGEIKILFNFDATELAGHRLVVFEYIYDENGTLLNSHEDINDENQTVFVPQISTKAFDSDTNSNFACADGKINMKDVVSYVALAGDTNYYLRSLIIDRDTNKIIAYKESAEFAVENNSGSIEVAFGELASEALCGHTLVVYEELVEKNTGLVVAIHRDINDKNQTIYIPAVKTSAKSDNGTKNIAAAKNQVIIDEISYSNLEPEKNYVLKSFVVDKISGKVLENAGKKAEYERNISINGQTGEIETRLELDATGCEGKTLVIYEEIYTENGVLLCAHRDINDKNQTIYVPELATSAVSATTGNHNLCVAEDENVKDVIEFKNLIPGKSYRIYGKIIDTEDDSVVSEAFMEEFVPEKSDGSVAMSFIIDTSQYQGKKLVVYEYLYLEDTLIAEHADKNDRNQQIYTLKIETYAVNANTSKKEIQPDKNQTIMDTVKIYGGVSGEKYYVRGRIYDATKGEYLDLDGLNEEAVIISNGKNEGMPDVLEMSYEIDASGLAGHDIVIFNYVYDSEGRLLYTHIDEKSTEQRINVKKAVVKPAFKVNTGDNSNIEPYLAGMLVSALVLYLLKKKSNR